jgi:hypothetical protein
MFDMSERVRTGLYLLDSDNVNNLTSPPPHFECLLARSAACLLATSAACLTLEIDEKLVELVRKCEELYEMSNVRNYMTCQIRNIVTVWKENTEYNTLA